MENKERDNFIIALCAIARKNNKKMEWNAPVIRLMNDLYRPGLSKEAKESIKREIKYLIRNQ